MAVSKKKQTKLDSKSKAKAQKAVATSVLGTQGKATPAQTNSDMIKADKALRRASIAAGSPKNNKKNMQTNASSKLKTAMKRVNQSVVARGGKPVKTYNKKVK
jgi:hypothetical protein